jgi:2'-5' RNA ligase
VIGAAGRRLRLFYALWPSDRLRAALARAVAPAILAIDGIPVPPGNLHVTLAFLGPVPGSRFASLVQVGGREAWPAVELAFERVEYWARPKVAVAVAARVPPEGQAIVDSLWRGLAPLGFEPEARPWRPHMTLVRKVRRPPAENLPLFPMEEAPDVAGWRLALVESSAHREGARYKPLADWGLSPSASAITDSGKTVR